MGNHNKDWKAVTLLIREVCMLKFMEDITNKPDWWHKVRDGKIVAKWKKEALSLNWAQYRRHGDFTKNMAEMVSCCGPAAFCRMNRVSIIWLISLVIVY